MSKGQTIAKKLSTRKSRRILKNDHSITKISGNKLASRNYGSGITRKHVARAKIMKEDLWDADPNCKHKIVSLWSGVECERCKGWKCL